MILLVAILLVVPLGSAAADPASDYQAVHRDWQEDGRITPCRWSEAQLQNARTQSESNPEDAHNSFAEHVDAELARRRRGDCAGRALARARLRIVAVQPRRERVRIVNRGHRAAALGGMRLRDRQGNTIRLPRGLRLRPGRAIVVRSGKRRIWDDRGDVARLVNRRGRVVSRYGYGRYKKTKRF